MIILTRIFLVIYLTFSAAISFAEDVCETGLVANVNAATPMSHYRQTNTRPFVTYTNRLGPRFARRFIFAKPGLRYLDPGGGFGLAAMEIVRVNKNVHATVVNAQDAWKFIFELSEMDAWFFKTTLATIGKRMGIQLDDVVDETTMTFTRDWYENLQPRISSSFAEVHATARFSYLAGLAEEVLPRIEGEFDVISDVFGGYFYSARRLDLLEEYYRKMVPGGEAFMVFHSVDSGEAYGPRNLVEGSSVSFEQALCELFPHIFSIYETSHEGAVTQVLYMKKIEPGVLNLYRYFQVIHSWLDVDAAYSLQRQLPNLKLRRISGPGIAI